MTTEGLELIPEEGVILRRTVGARVCDLVELTFNRWALQLGPAPDPLFPEGAGYDAQYTYDHPRPLIPDRADSWAFSMSHAWESAHAQAEAITAMLRWDGSAEPEGWIRAVVAGRPTRRRPDGDPAQEVERD